MKENYRTIQSVGKNTIGFVMFFLATLLTANLFALTPNLQGLINLNGSSSKNDSLSQNSLNQEYSLHWQKSITQNILIMSALNYFNFGSDEDLVGNSWRSEFQPSAEFLWRHPLFNAGTSIQRRDTKSSDETTNLVSDLYIMYFKSAVTNYPYLNLRAQQDNSYNRRDPGQRDTRDRLLQVGSGYDHNLSSIAYRYSRRQVDNQSIQREQVDNQHTVQLMQQGKFANGNVRVSAEYNFTYHQQDDINEAGKPAPVLLTVQAGLYSQDATPDVSTLDTLPALIDSNLTTPTNPVIDIGVGGVNWNIGADLGFGQQLNRIYVYTDKPSGSNVRWQVYASDDNSLWSLVGNSFSSFNASYGRYEIGCDVFTARYVKVVNSGLNEVQKVSVTEVEVLIETAFQGTIKRSQTTHLLTLGSSQKLSSKLSTNFDMSYQNQPSNDFSIGRNESYYSVGARYQPTSKITNSIRYQLGFINYHSETADVDKISSLSYNTNYKPLQALEFTLSLISRSNYIAGEKTQEINNLLLQSTGNIFTHLRTTTEGGFSRNNLYQSNQRFDTWTLRQTLDGTLTRYMDGVLIYLYQRTHDLQSAQTRLKKQYTANLNYRFTENIMLRGSVDLIDDYNSRYLSQEYGVSWNASEKLSFGGSVFLSDFNDGDLTERYSAELNYSLSRRTTLTASYSDNDFSGAGGVRTSSVRAGIRTGF